MAESGLRNTAIKGVGWGFTDSILNQGILFLVNIVLAHLITPDEYGMLGILMIFIIISEGIVNSGLSNALIRKLDASEKDYNTVFITNLILSFVMYGALYLCAPLISYFFERDQLTELLRVIGVMVILNALAIVPNTKLVKKVDFKTTTYCSFSASVISGIVGIGMALTGFGVWSLVGLQVSKQLILTIALWIANKWLPKIEFSVESFKELWGFGWKLLVSGLINNIWNEVYKIVVGKCYSPATLGQYNQAHFFADLFSRNMSNVIWNIGGGNDARRCGLFNWRELHDRQSN